MSKAELIKSLTGLGLPEIIFYEETDSTNAQGLKMAEKGAEEFTLLFADKQTAGRGRAGRIWYTKSGTSLAFSIILKPEEAELSRLALFSFLGALSVCEAIEAICTITPKFKWPNDVLIDGKKTAGILAESVWQGGKLCGVVLGIGINVLTGSVPTEIELIYPATDIEGKCGKEISRFDLLAKVLERLIFWRKKITSPDFLQAYRAHLAFMGERVLLMADGQKSIEGIMEGVDENGMLMIADEEGRLKTFPMGDLNLRQ